MLLGASNCKKLGVFDDNIINVINVSISGSTLDNIDDIVSKAKSIVLESNKCIDNIVVCLGTKDVTRNHTDPDEVNINVTNAINCVKLAFPDVKKNGICSILPRKGKGQNITRLNETTKIVNSFILKICKKDPVISLFSSPDPKGHVSYCHHLASVVRRKLFQKSSPLKVLVQWKPNLV